MRNALPLIALFGLVSLSGCDGGDGPKAPVPPATTPSAAVNPITSKINDDLTKLSYDVSKACNDGFIEVDVAPGDAFVKSAPAGEYADMQTYAADMNIWIAHPDPEFTLVINSTGDTSCA